MPTTSSAANIPNVTLAPIANVYFDGKCVSHTFHTADGIRKSAGVILPATLLFTTASAERMEITAGECQVKQQGASNWVAFQAGQSFEVQAQSAFEIRTVAPLHYICHYL